MKSTKRRPFLPLGPTKSDVHYQRGRYSHQDVVNPTEGVLTGASRPLASEAGQISIRKVRSFRREVCVGPAVFGRLRLEKGPTNERLFFFSEEGLGCQEA